MTCVHDCNSNSTIVHQLFVELLERVLFVVLNCGLGDQRKLYPLSSATLWAIDFADMKTGSVSIGII